MAMSATSQRAVRNADLDSAVADAERRYVAANPESRRRHEQATAVMPGGNTRTILFYTPFPLTLASGEAAAVTDVDGHRYVDFLGEYSAGLYGHSEPAIRRAVTAALADGIVLGGHNRFEAGLAAEMCARFPSLELVRFCNSGTEANLLALAMAKAVTGRPAAMVFDGGYHGGLLYFAHGGSPMNVPGPWVIAPFNDAEGAVQLIERHAHELAAIMVEPMQGSGGCLAAEKPFLAALREAATRHGIVLIFDEVMTSRLSPGGLQAALGILPDLTTFGKYLGGGLSFGAFGGKAEIMQRLDPRRPDALPHAGTFNNNVLAMAAGLAGLREVLTEAESLRLNRGGDELRERLMRLAAKHRLPMQFTGIGSLLGVHFSARPVRSVADLETDGPEAEARRAALQKLLHLDMLERGIYMARRGYIALSLPMTLADLDLLHDAFDEFMSLRGAEIAAAIQ
jgi:glutamate-1-semialdehyde 2,1-aminomutase